MTDLVAALQDKISALEDEKEELEDALARIEIKLETYAELLAEETGDSPAPAPKKRGRPKGSKNKKRATSKKKAASQNAPKDELWEQAAGSVPDGGTSEEEQAKALRRFNPVPRPQENYGVKAGKPEDVLGEEAGSKQKSHVTVSVED